VVNHDPPKVKKNVASQSTKRNSASRDERTGKNGQLLEASGPPDGLLPVMPIGSLPARVPTEKYDARYQ